MNNDNYHCLDINYKTEMELRAVSTYLFIFIVMSSFFYFHINRFMTEEIRHLNRELCFIRKMLPTGGSGSGSGSASGSESEHDSSSSGEECEMAEEIKFRGKRYIMT